MKPLRRAAHTSAGSAEPKPFCFLMKPQRFSRANWAASRPPCPSHTAKKATERRGRRPGPEPEGSAPSSGARGLPPLRRPLSARGSAARGPPGAAPPLCGGPRSASAGGSGSTTIWVTSSMYFLPPWSEYTLTPSEYGPSMGGWLAGGGGVRGCVGWGGWGGKARRGGAPPLPARDGSPPGRRRRRGLLLMSAAPLGHVRGASPRRAARPRQSPAERRALGVPRRSAPCRVPARLPPSSLLRREPAPLSLPSAHLAAAEGAAGRARQRALRRPLPPAAGARRQLRRREPSPGGGGRLYLRLPAGFASSE